MLTNIITEFIHLKLLTNLGSPFSTLPASQVLSHSFNLSPRVPVISGYYYRSMRDRKDAAAIRENTGSKSGSKKKKVTQKFHLSI